MFGDGDMSFSMAKSAKANKLVEFDCIRCGKHAEIQEGQKLRVVTKSIELMHYTQQITSNVKVIKVVLGFRYSTLTIKA